MEYTWTGMGRLTWEDVEEFHKRGILAGCFYLYEDGSKGEILLDYKWDDIRNHFKNGGDFGYERGFKKKCKCLQCGHEFDFESAEEDELGWHTTCPECEGSFDIDIEDYKEEE